MPGLITGRKRATQLDACWHAGVDDHVIALAWSPDGSVLAAAAIGGPITLYDGESGAIRHQLAGHSFGTTSISWSADGMHLASAGQDGKVRVWNPTSGAERWSGAGDAAWVERVAWCPVEPLLASAAGRKVKLWDADGRLVREYPNHPSTVSDLQWKPGARELTAAAYGGLTIWSPDSDEPTQRLEWQGSTLVIAWSPDKKYIATGDQDSTVHFWITRTGTDLQMFGYPTKVRELAWDFTSRYLATGGGPTIVIWDCSGKGPEGSTPIMLDGHDDLLSALAFQGVGSKLASAGQDGLVVIWQPVRTRKPLVRQRYDAGIAQLAWSPDDHRLAIGTEDGTVEVLIVR